MVSTNVHGDGLKTRCELSCARVESRVLLNANATRAASSLLDTYGGTLSYSATPFIIAYHISREWEELLSLLDGFHA